MPYADPAAAREQHRDYLRERYRDDDDYRARHKAAVKRSRAKARRARYEEIDRIKTECGCSSCGMTITACLDFHHRDPLTKLFEISRGITMGYAWARILAEIEKCDVLCSNCHRQVHRKSDTLPASAVEQRLCSPVS